LASDGTGLEDRTSASGTIQTLGVEHSGSVPDRKWKSIRIAHSWACDAWLAVLSSSGDTTVDFTATGPDRSQKAQARRHAPLTMSR
jgi:hypothetical protein